MSCQKENASRSRLQKHQNHTAFKNNLHDTSHETKLLNSIEAANVCERCKQVLEWKIKNKRYKLKAPAKCRECEQKTIKYPYHLMCVPCAKQREVCSRCSIKIEFGKLSNREQIRLDALLKILPERRRRFLLYKQQMDKNKKDISQPGTSEVDGKDISEDTTNPKSREDLLMKLKLLSVKEEEDDDNYDSDMMCMTVDDNLDPLT